MPLYPCPDCGREISPSAPACPGCGRPAGQPNAPPQFNPVQQVQITGTVPVRRVGGKYELIGGVLVVLGMFGLCAHPALGGIVMAVGFVVFLAGRFM